MNIFYLHSDSIKEQLVSNVIVLDSFFEDPKSIFDIALKQKYYSINDNPNDYSKKSEPISYLGSRTLSLKSILEQSIYNKIHKKILSTFTLNTPHNSITSIDANISTLFHALFENDLYEEKNIHIDSVLYAGIVYLNERLEGDHYGTLLNGVIIPYKFNRLVLYRADIPHTAMNGYGKDVTDSRLTLNFFINKVNISIINKQNKKYME
jgi:hypothetical protein